MIIRGALLSVTNWGILSSRYQPQIYSVPLADEGIDRGLSPARAILIHLLSNGWKEDFVGKPYSVDLRERIVRAQSIVSEPLRSTADGQIDPDFSLSGLS